MCCCRLYMQFIGGCWGHRAGNQISNTCFTVEAALEEDFRPWTGGFSRADVWKLTEEIASTNVQMVWEVQFGWP